MRGIKAQFIAPVVTLTTVAGLFAALGNVVVGLVVGAGLALVIAWLLASRLSARLEIIKDVTRNGNIDRQALAIMDATDEVDEAVRAVAQYAVNLDRRRVIDARQLEQQALMLDLMNDGLMRVDADRRVIYANVSAGALFGGRNPIGRSFLSVVRDHEFNQELNHCLATGQNRQHTLEIPGEGRLVNAVITTLPTQPPEALVTLRDITEVIRLQNLRRDFVANVSHELRTPLSTIKILTETLLDIRGEDEGAVEFLRKIDAEVDSMTALVRDLLDLTKLETPGGRLSLREIDAAVLIRDVCDRMRPLAERQRIALEAVPESVSISLVADERRLHQALINLVTNAIAHTAPGGSITVSARVDEPNVVFGVRDTGAGIAEEDLSRIWERFFKTDRARTGPGTGLGLAIVKHIAQAHEGSVAVTSAIGEGSEFTVSIPRGLRASYRIPTSVGTRIAPH